MKIDDLKFLKVKTEIHPITGITLEFLNKPNAIAIMLLNEKCNKTLLVNQYRPGLGDRLYEIPAGLIDQNEKPIDALYREIREETGYLRENIIDLYSYPKPLILSPGYTTEKLYIFIAKIKDNSIPLEQDLDEGEELFIEWIDLEKLLDITNDFKTIFAYNLYKNIEKA